MREILFRGKRKDTGELVHGNDAFTDNNDKQHFIFQNKAFEYEVIPETVGQYTDMTDKNGKKIFEGDIIDTPDRLVKVVWFTGNSQFDLDFIRYANDVTITNFKGIHMRDLKEYEIIGSIHDNPELLEGESNE